MRFFLVLALVAVGLGLVPAAASAQFDVNGPNARLTLQGKEPSTVNPLTHDVSVLVPGALEIAIETGANPNTALALIATLVDPTGPMLALPWGGSLDLGSPGSPLPGGLVLIGDGIGASTGPIDYFFASDGGNALAGIPPTFDLTLTAFASLAGGHVAFQAIVVDPTNAPFNLDMTEAGDANFFQGQKLLLNPTSAPVMSQVPFVGGRTFPFHGVSYTEVYVSSKGFVSFGGPSSYQPPGFVSAPGSFVNSQQGIAAFVADWASVVAPEGIVYEEIGNQVRISWGDPEGQPGGISHFADNDSNHFELRLELQDAASSNLGAGAFSIELINIDPSTTNGPGDGFIGHTPGGSVVTGLTRDLDLHRPQVSAFNEAQIEEHDATGTAINLLGYDGVGTRREYHDMNSWNGQTLTFTPNPWPFVPGETGYTSSAPPPAADVDGPFGGSFDAIGNSIAVLVGKFDAFNDATGLGGQVIFDPNGLALQAPVVGIRDGSGLLQPNLPNPTISPFRDGEALEIVLPDFVGNGVSAGPIAMRVIFDDGTVIDRTVNLTATSQLLTSYPVSAFVLANQEMVTHTLTTTSVDLYGVNYTSFRISKYGYIKFGGSSRDFSESLTDLWAGIPGTGTPMPTPCIAAAWSDFNSNGNTAAVFEVIEDSTLGTTRVRFRNQDHWQTGNPAGEFSVTMNEMGPNSVKFDHTLFIPDPSAANTHAVVVGISDGASMTGPNTNLSDGAGTGISGVLGSYFSSSAPDSFGELIPRGLAIGTGSFTALDVGDGNTTPYGTWTIF